MATSNPSFSVVSFPHKENNKDDDTENSNRNDNDKNSDNGTNEDDKPNDGDDYKKDKNDNEYIGKKDNKTNDDLTRRSLKAFTLHRREKKKALNELHSLVGSVSLIKQNKDMRLLR